MDIGNDDPIAALFRGDVSSLLKAAKPAFNVQRIEVNKRETTWKRELCESSTSGISEQERKILSRFLNAPKEEIERECTLGIENDAEVVQNEPYDDLRIYSRYEFNLSRQCLPIARKYDEILDTVKNNDIVIIKANTGSGKSSQVPQYILEDSCRRKRYCNIIVTQPRRISAVTLAERVAFERKCEVGSLVGYQIGLDKNLDHNDTRILYVTTGIFLQKLVNQKSVSKWTHIIIDEIHERDIDMDLVLLILRRLLIAQNTPIKIILMSATMNSEKISNYFGISKKVAILNLNIEKPYAVKVQYLDNITHLGVKESFIDLENPGICQQMYQIGVDLVMLLINKGIKTFLIFLPGLYEIESFERVLKQFKSVIDNFKIITLHSSIPASTFPELYDTKFKEKIILSTNIAESSVTIKEIEFVIDYCLIKHIETERDSNITQLKVSWASKMNLIQRSGRTGRTNIGQVVRMIFEKHYPLLDDEPKAEMQRMPLENVILKAKKLDMGRPCDLLAISLDPPKRRSIVDGILSLKESFALTRYMSSDFNLLDGNITAVGEIMNKLPIDIRLTKLIIFGHLFNVFNEAVIIAAGMSVRSIFTKTKYQSKMSAYEMKLSYDSTSDCIAILKAYQKYNEWRRKLQNGNRLSYNIENEWCNRHMINLKHLRDMERQIMDIHDRLQEFKMDSDTFTFSSSEEKVFVTKLAIAGAFYPNIFSFGGNIPMREIFRAVNDKNILSTVYFKGFQRTKHGHLYEEQFRKVLFENGIIDNERDQTIYFDNNSSKVFIDLNSLKQEIKVKMPGDAKLEVYKAIRLRKFTRKSDLTINVMSKHNEKLFEEQFPMPSIADKELKFKDKVNIYPNNIAKQQHAEDYLHGKITNIISPGKFYFQPKKGTKLHSKIMEKINQNLIQVQNLSEEIIDNNKIIVKVNGLCKRGQIIAFPKEDDNELVYKVKLIDFGSIARCRAQDFYTAKAASVNDRKDLLNDFFKIPPLCYECKLAKVQPTFIQQYGWSSSAINNFKSMIQNRDVEIDLYAFNHNDIIASVEVILRNSSSLTYVSRTLIKENLAKEANESYVTVLNRFSNNTMTHLRYEMLRENKQIPIRRTLFEEEVWLDGPYSPLETIPKPLYRARESNLNIDKSSVNNILIDPYVYDGVQKFLIAASKSMNERSGAITLHQTTIMPNLKGMCSLITLIFCPYAEVRINKENTRYTSILAGLGCDFSGAPYFGEHDCLIQTDVEIDNEDLRWINDLRREMSLALANIRASSSSSNICHLLLKIMKKCRIQLNTFYDPKIDSFEWNQDLDEGYPTVEQMFAKHEVTKLEKISFATVKRMNHHIRELDQMARDTPKNEELFCKLCDQQLSLLELKFHLSCSMHNDLKKKYTRLYNDVNNNV